MHHLSPITFQYSQGDFFHIYYVQARSFGNGHGAEVYLRLLFTTLSSRKRASLGAFRSQSCQRGCGECVLLALML